LVELVKADAPKEIEVAALALEEAPAHAKFRRRLVESTVDFLHHGIRGFAVGEVQIEILHHT
jgi:hypothetical protein